MLLRFPRMHTPTRVTSRSAPALISRACRLRPSNLTCMHMSLIAARRWLWQVGPITTFKHHIYFCNIQMKLLQHMFKTDKTLETYGWNTIATYATSRSTFKTSRYNTYNIRKKSRLPIDQPLNWHLVDMIYESTYIFQRLSKDGTEWGNTLAKFLQKHELPVRLNKGL
jgi:hypothetical protein